MNEIFCKKLKELREEHGISQASLATSLGTYQQTVARWEKGITEPDTKMMKKICLYFKVTADELLDI